MKRNRMQKACIPVFIALLSGLLLIGAVSATEFGPWSIQTVDSGGNVGQYSSVALDAGGNPAISYYDQTYGDLKYAVWDGSGWVISTVDCSRAEPKKWWSFWDRSHDRTKDDEYIRCFHGTDKVGKYSSLAFDTSGMPRISYFDETNGDLKYAAWDGSRWVVTTVDRCKQVGEYSSLALDSSGNPRISYYDKSKDDLKYAAFDGSRWVISTVDSSKNVGEYSSLALDSSGMPRISYYDQTNKDLKYAAFDGSRWVITTVDGSKDRNGHTRDNRDGHAKDNWDGDRGRIDDRSKNVGKYSSLALDSSDKPAISYYDQTNKDLKYAAWDGSRWVITTVDSAKSVGEYSSLKLDENGDPRISYYDASRDDLKFAAWNSTTSRWVTETVDSSGKVGSFTSLALDSLGNARISYYDQTHKDLKYTAGSGHVPYPKKPTVTAISPSGGPVTGGTFVTITGTWFIGATAVTFGATGATSFTVVNANSITAISPAGAPGVVNVTVTTPYGTSANSTANQFTYYTAPTVTAISPASGTISGGTVVTISGTGFTGVTNVTFGTTGATTYTVVNATSITATSPASAAGVVDVTVTTPGGTSANSAANQFAYVIPPPTVTAISPTSGTISGGTMITITGTWFTDATAVTFGTTGAPAFTVINATSITATSPASAAGVVNVTVTTPGGTSATTPAGQFTYYAIPTVTAISPAAGPAVGGTVVTVTGTGFTGATAVRFGTTAGTSLSVTNDTSLSITSPAGSGTVNITVTTPFATSTTTPAGQFTYYVTPMVTSISPTSGTTSGGTVVTVTGTGFTGATAVRFGTTGAPTFTVVNATSITATTPAGSGTVNITVTTPGGTSATTPAAQFTYYATPTVTAISPTSGPSSGGTVVTVTGTGFTGATAVRFGTTAGTSLSVNSDTQITVTSPTGVAGPAGVTVTTPGGTSTAYVPFTYIAAPTVTGVSPTGGPAAGGTPVVITGTGFTGATAVRFGGTAATSFTVINDARITVTSPPGSGTVTVTVTTSGGTSTQNVQFTYSAAPTVSGITPNSGTAGTSVTVTDLAGSNFVAGASVRLAKTGQADIIASPVTVVSPNKITCTLPLTPYSSTIPGLWDVIVTNPDGQAGWKNASFTIINPPPSITSITPNHSPNGTTVAPVTVVGENFGFGQNPSVWLAKAGQGNIYATDVHLYGTTSMTFTLVIPASAPPGLWDVMVMSEDGQTSANLGAFTIDDQAGGTFVWDWSVNGWGDWQYGTITTSGSGPVTPGPTTWTEYGPLIDGNSHGVYGADIKVSNYYTISNVSKTFTDTTGTGWSTLTFTGTLSSVATPFRTNRWMDIWVNGNQVFTANAAQTPPGNGQQFTIPVTFPKASTVIVKISSWDTATRPSSDGNLYTMQFNSLTLS